MSYECLNIECSPYEHTGFVPPPPLYISSCELFCLPDVWLHPFVNFLNNHWNNFIPTVFFTSSLKKKHEVR